jgi:hypothetical protein
MSLVVNGTITKVIDVETGTSKAGKAWKKQSFVVDTGEAYNPEVCFSLFGDDKVDMLKQFAEGESVEVAFNVSSREFNGKYYHNIDAWKISKVGTSVASPVSAPFPAGDVSGDDDLPF